MASSAELRTKPYDYVDLINLFWIDIPYHLSTAEDLHQFWETHHVIEAVSDTLDALPGVLKVGDEDQPSTGTFSASKSGYVIDIAGERKTPGGFFDYNYALKIGGYAGVQASFERYVGLGKPPERNSYNEDSTRFVHEGHPKIAAILLKEAMTEIAAAVAVREKQQQQVAEVVATVGEKLGPMILGAAMETGLIQR